MTLLIVDDEQWTSDDPRSRSADPALGENSSRGVLHRTNKENTMSDQADKSREQAEAESAVEAYREKLGPFVVAAETTRMPMVFSNATAGDHPIVFVNQAFLDLTGYEEHEVLGQRLDFLIERGTDPQALVQMQTAFEGGRDLETPVRFQRKDGARIWVSVLINPVRDCAGTVVQHFASFADITASKREEERVTTTSVQGFGRRLIEGDLARNLNGEVSLGFEVSGVTCENVMPVSRPIGK